MAYLTRRDYFVIQDYQLNQLIQGQEYRLSKAQNTAQEELTSYLIQRWDTTGEFTDTQNYNSVKVYNPGDRVVLDFPAFSQTNSYSIGDCVVNNKIAYIATANVMPGVFNISNWSVLGNQYDIFYGAYNYPLFDSNNNYSIGDVVYWRGYNYTCATATTINTPGSNFEYNTYSQIPPKNVLPDSAANSTGAYWNNKTAYSIPAGTSTSNTMYWNSGDNRSQQMVMYMMDIAIYHLHKSIAPQNIPDMRKEAYRDALKWAKMCAMGDVAPNLPKIQPTQGLKIRWGSNTKSTNGSW